jgi:hypothetical protein
VLLRFAISDTMSLDSVKSLQLVLHAKDTLHTMNFVCRPCSSAWIESGVSWAMSDSENHWMSPGGDFLPDTLCSGTIAGDSVMFDFRYVGLDSALKSAIRANGVCLFPLDTGWVSVYSGSDATKAPRLRITYSNSGKETGKVMSDNADASLVDTLRTWSNPLDLLVGSGTAFRTWLRFTLDSIPSEATIARADLVFRPEVKYRRLDTLLLGVHRLLESYPSKGANARFDDLPGDIDTLLAASDSDTLASFDIRGLVQYWTTHRDSAGRDTSNFGLLIASAPEWSNLFRLRIPRSGPNAPRLEIQYVLPPEDRFR